MSTITKERAQQIFLGNGTEPTASEERELARIALASIEAVPVACPKCSGTGMADSGGVYPWGEGINVHCDCTFPDPELSLLIHDLHIDGNHRLANVIQDLIEGRSKGGKIKNTAPPAPVSVPDEIRLLQSEVTIWKDRWELLRELFREVADALGCDVKDNQAMLDKIEMLQGAAENSPVIPDGWVACSERMPEGMTDVHISNGHDVGQGWWDGDAWQTQHDYYSVPGDVTHWMPLPAAPQQEA